VGARPLPATNIQVELVPTRPTPQNPLPFPVAETRTGSDGIYELRNIRPGEYYLTISCAFCATLDNGGQGSLMRMAICLAVLLGLTDLWATDADFTVGGGAGPAAGNARTDPNGKDVSPDIGATLLFNGSIEFLHYKKAAVGLEVPLAIHGFRSSNVFAQGGYAGIYTERLTAVLTPGIRVRLAPVGRHISPWLSFGAGIAVIHRTGNDFQIGQPAASQVGSSRVPALVPAAGVDIRLARRSFARIEMRNYLYKTPATGFVSSFVYWNRWNYNPVVVGSVGFRLR